MPSPAQAIRRSGDSHGKFPMIPLYSLLAIGFLLLALYAARRVTKREKLWRARGRGANCPRLDGQTMDLMQAEINHARDPRG